MKDVRSYALVTACYWLFTLSDGALRMLVLLHLHDLGFGPFQLASLFLLYEFFGVVTNWCGGWIGSRFGLKSTLVIGLALQVGVLLALHYAGEAHLTVGFVMGAQALSGVAKDLTKMSSKSYIKLVVKAGDEVGLMRWVALLTGSKNTLKGVGFFLGAALLAWFEFPLACLLMALPLAWTLLFAVCLLPRAAGKSKSSRIGLWSDEPRLNWLAAARLFLFGSRDVWFVVALPVFLAAELGWGHAEVGGFLAAWVIGYGVVQALAPRYAGRRPSAAAKQMVVWKGALLLPLAGLFAFVELDATNAVFVGLPLFGIVFATISALHSYLVLAYSAADSVAVRVGFYYMANAAGRLIGTVLSGALFELAGQGTDGLRVCVGASAALVVGSLLFSLPLVPRARSS